MRGDEDAASGTYEQIKSTWLRLRPLLGDSGPRVVVLTVASVLAGFAEACVLALIAQVGAAMASGEDTLHADLGPIAWDLPLGRALALAFAISLARAGLQLVVAWLPARVSTDVQARLRRDLFSSFTNASWEVQSSDREGSLQELMTNHTNAAAVAVLQVSNLLTGTMMFATLVASAFVLSIPVALIVLVSAIGLLALLRPLNRSGRNAAEQVAEADLNQAAGVSESVRLAEETKVFGTSEAERARVGRLIDVGAQHSFTANLTARLAQFTYQSVAILLVVGGLSGLYVVGSDELASLGAVVLILVRAGTYGQNVQGCYHHLHQLLPYLARVEQVIARYEASVRESGSAELDVIRNIEFRNVFFAYRRDRPVLRDVSFEITRGDAIGVVGPSGAGKSTLVQLLLRLREPSDGDYWVNGQAASAFAAAQWHQRITYVPQEPKVFQGSVANNIRYFRDLDMGSVERAARLAHIHDDIERMESGYETEIGQRSDAVSGGQRQRICLARALAARPDVLVLDEPTSALDLESEAAIQASLASLHRHVTLIIVAHRLSTLALCSKVLVLSDGRVEAFAPPDELLKSNTFFRRASALTSGAS